MSWFCIPPVRRAVPTLVSRGLQNVADVESYLQHRPYTAFESGTQALTAALRECVLHEAASHEVLIPAYGCPDLVAACIGAGMRPVLVDVAEDGWGLDPGQLAQRITSRTVAVVAVNLLGVGDDSARLRQFADNSGIALIQDSAQHLPRESPNQVGDFMVLSFGRGKPLNLLGGGLLIGAVKGDYSQDPLPDHFWKMCARGILFNVATDRRFYTFARLLAGRRVGETEYRNPVAPRRSHAVSDRFSAELPSYRQEVSYFAGMYSHVLPDWSRLGVRPLIAADGGSPSTEPLRLAMLANDRHSRDSVVFALQNERLGASAMYRVPLSRIPTMPPSLRFEGPFPNAERLADRLFTLPTHLQVRQSDIALIDRAIRKALT